MFTPQTAQTFQTFHTENQSLEITGWFSSISKLLEKIWTLNSNYYFLSAIIDFSIDKTYCAKNVSCPPHINAYKIQGKKTAKKYKVAPSEILK